MRNSGLVDQDQDLGFVRTLRIASTKKLRVYQRVVMDASSASVGNFSSMLKPSQRGVRRIASLSVAAQPNIRSSPLPNIATMLTSFFQIMGIPIYFPIPIPRGWTRWRAIKVI